MSTVCFIYQRHTNDLNKRYRIGSKTSGPTRMWLYLYLSVDLSLCDICNTSETVKLTEWSPQIVLCAHMTLKQSSDTPSALPAAKKLAFRRTKSMNMSDCTLVSDFGVTMSRIS